MLNENLKQLRKSKGLTQAEFELKFNVVRQTVSKWEKGLSVPDAEMLMEIADQFDIPVADILGKTIEADNETDHIKVLSEKFALLNEQYAKNVEKNHRIFHRLWVAGIVALLGYMVIQIFLCFYSYALSNLIHNTGTAYLGTMTGEMTVYVLVGANFFRILFLLTIFAVSVIGVYLSRRTRDF